MIKLITGEKGTGKTKILVDMIKEAVEVSSGDIVCIEKGIKLTYDIPYKVRLVAAEEYSIDSFDTFFGFVAGMLAGNYDVQKIYVDGILKMGGRDYEKLGEMLDKLNSIAKDVEITFTVSCDASNLPQSVMKYA